VDNTKNYIIYGIGRCGSHWVESIISDLCGSAYVACDNIRLLPNGWILNTHMSDKVTDIPVEVRESTTLILCDRENKFEQIISYLIAEKTNEWHGYTDKKIPSFNISPEEFEQRFDIIHAACMVNFTLADEKYAKVVKIVYEDLVKSLIPEQYIAKLIGLPYTKTEGFSQDESKKNPRNYKDLILNWKELKEISDTLLLKNNVTPNSVT
jgi:hypothetical protein